MFLTTSTSILVLYSEDDVCSLDSDWEGKGTTDYWYYLAICEQAFDRVHYREQKLKKSDVGG